MIQNSNTVSAAFSWIDYVHRQIISVVNKRSFRVMDNMKESLLFWSTQQSVLYAFESTMVYLVSGLKLAVSSQNDPVNRNELHAQRNKINKD